MSLLLQHEIKKIRNSLLGSGLKGKKKIHHKDRAIYWKNWVDAYNRECTVNSMRIHHHLVKESLEPNGAEKTRNKYANIALNAEMLHLTEVSLWSCNPNIFT